MWMLPALVTSTLVLNEVLYDPPGADAGREFVEIFNVSPDPVPLAGLELETADGAHPGTWRRVWTGSSGMLAPGALWLVAGDSLHAAARLTADLQNGPDAIRLRRGSEVLDTLGYGMLTDPSLFEGRPAADVTNASLARVPDGRDTGDNAADFITAMPTPGRRNQLRVNVQLGGLEVDPFRSFPDGVVRAAVTLRNTGADSVLHWALAASRRSVFGEPLDGDAAFGDSIPVDTGPGGAGIAPHDSVRAVLQWAAPRGVYRLHAELVTGDDDALDDHAVAWVRVGAGAVVVNEILYVPVSGQPEWIELWNRGDRARRVNGWTLSDASGRRATLRGGGWIPAGGWALVSADSRAAIAGAPSDAVRIASSPWLSLNDSDGPAGFADQLVLRDPLGIVHDAVRYADADVDRGRSLERVGVDPGPVGVRWAPCTARSGATPGAPNTVHGPAGADPRLDLAPNPFSPNGDGYEDQLLIRAELPADAASYRLEIFDLDGQRRAAPGADRLGPGQRLLVWDGRSDRGDQLPEGVYVLRFEWHSKSGGRQAVRRAVGLVRR